MPLSIRQVATTDQAVPANPITMTFGAATLPTSMIVWLHARRNLTGAPAPDGTWTGRASNPLSTSGGGGSGGRLWAYERQAVGETTFDIPNSGSNVSRSFALEVDAGGNEINFDGESELTTGSFLTSLTAGTITPTSGASCILLLLGVNVNGRAVAAGSNVTEISNALEPGSVNPRVWLGYRVIPSASGGYTPSFDVTGGLSDAHAALVLDYREIIIPGGIWVPPMPPVFGF